MSYGAVILDEQYLALRRLINEAVVAGRYIKTWSQDMRTKWPPMWQAIGEDPYIVLGSFVNMRAVALDAQVLFYNNELRVLERQSQGLFYEDYNLRITRDSTYVYVTDSFTVGMVDNGFIFTPFQIKKGYIELFPGSSGMIELKAPYGTIELFTGRVKLATGYLDFTDFGTVSATWDLAVKAGRILMLGSDTSTIYLILGSNKYVLRVDEQGYVRALPVTG